MADSYSTIRPKSVFVADSPVLSFDVAADEDGNFVVAWETEEKIKFTVFDSDGEQITEEQTLETFDQTFPSSVSVSMLPDGTFAIAYDILDLFDGDREIQAQSFDVSGEKIGDTIFVTDNTEEDENPDIAIGENGELLVTWESFFSPDNSDIVLSYFDSEDNLVDSSIIASSSDSEFDPSIALRKGNISDNDGDTTAIVTFTRENGFSGDDVFFQQFQGDQYELKGEPTLVVPAEDNIDQNQSSVAMDENGNSVITFTDNFFDNGDVVLVPVTEEGEFFSEDVVASEDDENNPVVAMTDDGSFVIAFANETQEEILAQEYNSESVPINDPFRVEGITQQPAIAVSPDGDTLVIVGETSDEDVEAAIYNRSSNGGDGDREGLIDFNQDGKSDILWRNSSTGQNRVWLMDNRERLDSVLIRSREDLGWYVGGEGDFDGDGNTDIAWSNSDTGENEIWYMDQTELIDTDEIEELTDLDWEMRGSGDFNGDGNADLVWRNQSTGQNGVWFMDGSQRIGTANLQTRSQTEWDIYGVNDFDADGDPDLLWHNQLTRRNQIWLMDETTREETVKIGTIRDEEVYIGTTGYFNDDPYADIVLRNSSTGRNRVWLMDGSGGTVERIAIESLPASFDTDWQIV